MKRLMSALAVGSAFVMAAPAFAANPGCVEPSPLTIAPGSNVFYPNTGYFGTPSGSFSVSGPDGGGGYSAGLTRAGLASGAGTDLYCFHLPANGLGSGSVTTNVNVVGSSLDLDFTSVDFSNDGGATWIAAILDPFNSPANEKRTLNGIPITMGALNILRVSYLSRGNGSYGGQLTFEPARGVPEPATWALMMLGFGAIGFAMRRRKQEVRVRYA